MKREALERRQAYIYVVAVLGGLAFGTAAPESVAVFETMLWPALGLLLFATFVQVPLSRLRAAFVDGRFLAAGVVGNFVVLPVVVWGLLALVPDDPAVRLGVLLVLLVPCTDWFITFAQLGGGDAGRAIAFSPLALLLQMLLLPAYLWLFLGGGFGVALARGEMVAAFFGLIGAPLLLAFITQRWVEADVARRAALLERLGWLPVPLLAVVVFMIAASQVNTVAEAAALLAILLLVFVLFLGAAAVVALVLARLFALPPVQGRALAFSLGTRNSFVVLPLALALPASWEAAVVVIVFQSLVELFSMIFYLWWVPTKLFPAQPP